MKLAIPVHQGRVAPVFETCRQILVVVQETPEDVVIAKEDWSGIVPQIRPKRLKELGVQALLCGGISCWMENQVSLQGIHTVPWLAGDVSEVLKAFREGREMDPRYAMPGRAAYRRKECMSQEGVTESRQCARSGKAQGTSGRGRKRTNRRGHV